MNEIFSSRLIIARKMASMSMQELSKISNVSKQAISQYEKGEMMPSSDYLMRLSNALNIDIDFFFRKSNSDDIKIASDIHYREEKQILKDELSIIKLKTIDFLEKFFELEKIADYRNEFKNPIKDVKVTSKKDAEKAAKVVRKKWKLGNIPLKNILSILEAKEVKVFEVEASEKFNGFAAWAGKVPVIVINLGFGEITRVRFTTLHELGHLILGIDNNIDNESIERLCDAFASELLLPEELLVVEIGKKRTRVSMHELRNIKEKYGISIMAIMVKLSMKGVITKDIFNQWKLHYNELYKNDENVFGNYLGEETTKKFNQLLSKCLIEKRLSVNKAASLSNLSINELNQIHNIDSKFYIN